MSIAHVAIHGTRYNPLTDAAISDASACVHAHHVVYPTLIPVESNEVLAEDTDERIGYEWWVDISTRPGSKQSLFRDLTEHADHHKAEVNLAIVGDSTTLSYMYGDRMVG